jgi:predicted PP-loop superfamily ATPase
MDRESLEAQILEIRAEQGLERGVPPRILDIRTEEGGSLKIIVADRAEKSMCLGPGGRIIAQLAQNNQKHITVVAVEEELVQEHRMRTTISRIDEIQEELNPNQSVFVGRLRKATERRLSGQLIEGFDQLEGPIPAVALSGGADSCATMIILGEMGLNPVGLTVKLPKEHETHRAQDYAGEICQTLNCRHLVVQQAQEFDAILGRTKQGRIHPCGECHDLILAQALQATRAHGLDILVTGELLPTGRQAIVKRENVLLIHLPAALGLTKYLTSSICRNHGFDITSSRFGCALVRQSHKMGWRGVRPSIYRVLRETQANVLTPGQSITYIRSILEPLLTMYDEGGQSG